MTKEDIKVAQGSVEFVRRIQSSLEANTEPMRVGPEHNLINRLTNEMLEELMRARRWPAMNSAHEGFAVLAEEVDELWAHVKTKQTKRDLDAMRKEAIQVAAMAIRFAHDVCNEERGRR